MGRLSSERSNDGILEGITAKSGKKLKTRTRRIVAHILLLNGPNLNLLGTREPEHYGTSMLSDIEKRLHTLAIEDGHRLSCMQSNAEHELVARIQKAPGEDVAVILINPAAFTHTSVALRDALAAVAIPFIEIHLSNVYRREAFRHRSYLSDLAVGVIVGFGPQGYELAYRAAASRFV